MKKKPHRTAGSHPDLRSKLTHLRDLDGLVHRKVCGCKKIRKVRNHRTPHHLMRLVRKLMGKGCYVEIGWHDDRVSVLIQNHEREEITLAPDVYVAACVAAVRWVSLGLFPHDLGNSLGVIKR